MTTAAGGAFYCYQTHNPKPNHAILRSTNTRLLENRFVVYVFYKYILRVNLSVSEDFLVSCSQCRNVPRCAHVVAPFFASVLPLSIWWHCMVDSTLVIKVGIFCFIQIKLGDKCSFSIQSVWLTFSQFASYYPFRIHLLSKKDGIYNIIH